MRTFVITRVGSARGRSFMEIMVVVAIVGVLAVIAVPMVGNALSYFRVSGDARGISNAIAVVKIRAASSFTQARLYVSLTDRKHKLQTWNKSTLKWTTEGGDTQLSSGVIFSYSPVANAPTNTQGTIGQAPLCKDDSGNDVASTSCVIFNSRGIPVDSGGTPTPVDALYVTDGVSVYGVTLSATGMTRTWRAQATSSATWVQQ